MRKYLVPITSVTKTSLKERSLSYRKKKQANVQKSNILYPLFLVFSQLPMEISDCLTAKSATVFTS